jgi:nucleoid DNA-binding protein
MVRLATGLPVDHRATRARGKNKMAKATKKPAKMTKAALLQTIADALGETTTRKQVKLAYETLVGIGAAQLKKSGEFVLPGLVKLKVVKKAARPARKGINPFTKEPTTFAAKPASKAIKARPVKALKDAIAE